MLNNHPRPTYKVTHGQPESAHRVPWHHSRPYQIEDDEESGAENVGSQIHWDELHHQPQPPPERENEHIEVVEDRDGGEVVQEEGGDDIRGEEAQEVEGAGEEEVHPPRQPPPPPYRPPHRRRREEWIFRRDAPVHDPQPAGAEGVQQPAQAAHQAVVDQPAGPEVEEQPIEAANQMVNLAEEVRAQVEHPDITRTGRVRKKPTRFGFEEHRNQDDDQDLVLHLSQPPSREITPISSAAPSPDTSLSRENEPSPPAEPPDVLMRHRHFSIGGGETDSDRPYPMIDWMPYPEERPPPSH